MKRISLVAFVAVSVLLSGCGESADVKPAAGDDAVPTVADSTSGTDSDSALPSATAEPDLPTDDDLRTYFDAIASAEPSKLESVLNLTEQGSVAYAFADYQRELVNAYIDGGGSAGSANTVVKTDEGFDLCFTNDEGEETCQALGDIEGRAGKIVSFTIDRENLKKRISAGNGKPVRAGGAGSVEMLYAYKRVSNGDLVVVIRLRSNGDAISVGLYEATYRAPSGRQSTAADIAGNTELGSDSTSTAALYFTDAEVGGEVTMSLFTNDYLNESEVTLATR